MAKRIILLVTNDDLNPNSQRQLRGSADIQSNADIVINTDTLEVIKHRTERMSEVLVIRHPRVTNPVDTAFKPVLAALDNLAAATLRWKHALGMDEGEGRC